jgi:predicted nucleic acid-binding protein
LTLCLIDTGIFLCLAFEDPGYQQCGKLLDKAFKGEITPLLSSIQLTELYAPFLRANDLAGLKK